MIGILITCYFPLQQVILWLAHIKVWRACQVDRSSCVQLASFVVCFDGSYLQDRVRQCASHSTWLPATHGEKYINRCVEHFSLNMLNDQDLGLSTVTEESFSGCSQEKLFFYFLIQACSIFFIYYSNVKVTLLVYFWYQLCFIYQWEFLYLAI